VQNLKTFLTRPVLLVALFLVPKLLLASTILDTGLLTFTPTGTQFGRISRDGVPSDWSGPKTFPGVTGAPTPRGFEVFTVNAGPFAFIQVLLDDPTASLFNAAYLSPFTPVNIAPNYGLNVNYLGDPGLTQPVGNPSFFQIVVTPNSNFLIVINEINPGGGLGNPFQLLVEGFCDTAYNDTCLSAIPEPSSLLLLGGGVIVLAGLAHGKRKTHQAEKANLN
jgi:hypothetical protein